MKITQIVIPQIDNDGSDNTKTINQTISSMIDLFGGATAWDGRGYWKNDNGRLYQDLVTIIQSAATHQVHAEMDELASLVLEATDQEAVFYIVDGRATIKTR